MRVSWLEPTTTYRYSQALLTDAPRGRSLTLSWDLFNDNKEIGFKLVLRGVLGWLALGLAKQSPPHMCGNNVMMATSSGRLGPGFYAAAHLVNCTAWGTPQMATDIANAIVPGYAVNGATAVYVNSATNTTTLLWRRLLSPCTCADPDEPQIDPFGSAAVLWAFGENPDGALGYHDKNAGFATVKWLPDAQVRDDGVRRTQ